MSAAQPAPVMFEYTGTLLKPAEARTRPIDGEGHCMPVLCLDVELDTPLRTRLHVEQVFPCGHFDQARAAAHRYTTGLRVTVQAPPQDIQLVARHAAHIHIVKPTQEEPA